jgi:hypothetical protein
MSQNSFISDADAALASLIWACIESEPTARNLISSKEQIWFSSPKASDAKGTRKLSVFLYSITEETADASRKGTGHTSFALRYLVTPFTGNDKDDHVLLGKIIHALSASPRIAGTDAENEVGFTVKVDSLSLEELTKLWTTLGTPLRLSVSLTVSSDEPRYDQQANGTSAPATPQKPLADSRHVTQLYQAVLKTFAEQSNDWSKRNMAVKQWLLRDFKKNTDMTVEEMQTTLNNLGSKLEQHGSTTQFIKPLNQLAGYYEHQLNELKGLHKITHRQGENIEMISAWIKEVKDLVEALGGNRQA